MGRFVPVSDPEKARCEQDDNDLRKHRQFDNPFALLKKDLNDKGPRQSEDNNPLGRPTGKMQKDDRGLWRDKSKQDTAKDTGEDEIKEKRDEIKEKNKLFDKQQSWGRETVEYSNPEESRADGNAGPKWGRKGVVGWGVQGRFGGRDNDVGLAVSQRGEVDQTMVKNEKGLWVKAERKRPDEGAGEASSSKMWKCSGCGAETSKTMEFCRMPSCDGKRPNTANASKMQSSKHEDPRLEAAKPKGRGTADAAKLALKALEERRAQQQKVQDKMGMTGTQMRQERPRGDERPRGGYATQVKPAHRLGGAGRWQGVQRTDEEATRIVGKALGCAGEREGQKPIRIDTMVDTLRPKAKKEDEEEDLELSDGPDLEWDVSDSEERAKQRGRSRSRTPPPAKQVGDGEVEVDFF